jgi:hypothetical protein
LSSLARIQQLALLTAAGLMLSACPGDASGSTDPIHIDARMHLGEKLTVALEPSVDGKYSYSLEVPPQGSGQRYEAALQLHSTLPGKTFRARLTTTCSEHAGEADEFSSSEFADGAIQFGWSAQYSSQFVQIVSDEADAFDLEIELRDDSR